MDLFTHLPRTLFDKSAKLYYCSLLFYHHRSMNAPFALLARRTLLALCCLGGLLGCQNESPTLTIDTSHPAQNYGERIRFIVLHYTATDDNDTSLQLLTEGKHSSHYLIMKGGQPIYQLVADDKAAWHAGVSEFRGLNNLNSHSIGIEIVNVGIDPRYLDDKGRRPYHHYVDYDEIQIHQVGQLVQALAKTYHISPRNIIAHSDIAPSRKSDPGAKFPWQRLYTEYGVGAWYDETDKRAFVQEGFGTASVKDIKAELRRYGYAINDTNNWDKESEDVVYAFQLHFNPKNATGKMDVETYAILRALNKKYVDRVP